MHTSIGLSLAGKLFSPGQPFLEAKALPREGKILSPIPSQTWYKTVFSLTEMLFHPMVTNYENKFA